MFKFFNEILAKKKEKDNMKEALNLLIEESEVSFKFLLFSVLASVMATLGLIMNNLSILIGAMLIAPLLIPVISLSVGVGAGSIKLIKHSIKALFLGISITILTAMLVTWLLAPETVNTEVYDGFSNTFHYGLVAIIAGIIGVYSWFQPNSNRIVPGVAIAVALVPPIAFAGEAIALRDNTVLIDTIQVITFNLGGIFLGGLITFIIYAISSKRRTQDVGKQVDTHITNKVK